ncbi:hypothetical protein INT48_004293 [Thamnidium elegans]|uniref:Uncharacterized protein n=1 Tax=Thamnidium elegans TaxID=101142 RepID=A0A8H7SXI2_9FUNG|nr:hypothetical protein INT48_004293 [Thamnidium elegans]
MKLKHTRNVLHLAITESTALRVVIYIAENKIDWYNENGLHALVLDALYPVVIDNLIVDQGAALTKRQKVDNYTIQMDGFRILYRFIQRNSQQTLIETEKDFTFASEEEDEKPIIETKYKPLSVYPYQLLISVDDELFMNSTKSLDSYFQIL